MRIIGGTHGGRRIDAPRNLPLRPTTDFAKESIFNILQNRFDFEDLSVLDLFSGTGAISYEFASRGAKKIISVEKNLDAYKFIKKRSAEFGFSNISVLKTDSFYFLDGCKEKFDLIFADPPYDMKGIEQIHEFVFKNSLLSENGTLIVEHSSKIKFEKTEQFLEKRVYGDVNFSIFSSNKPTTL